MASVQRHGRRTTLLHLDASVRGERSLSRRLSRAFVDAWLAEYPGTRVIRRDLATQAPPFVEASWIAAAFTDPAARSGEMRELLAPSDEMIDEIEAADVIVLGTPMFNYGMPARLKAWVDQVIRVGRTFTFDLARGDYPLEPILSGKALALLTSTGEFGFAPGHARAGINHLDTHIRVVCGYIGVSEVFHLGVEYQEFGDERHTASLETASAAIPDLVAQVAAHSALAAGEMVPA